MPRTSTSPYRIVALTLALVVVLSGPLSARGTVAQTDVIGSIAIADSVALQAVAPDVDIPSGALETFDGEVLWSRDADVERAMASTTKIMTAVVVLESVENLDEVIIVPAKAVRVGESAVGIKAGEQQSIRDLLAAMLVHSANEAAVALALFVSGSEEGFADLMNAKVAELGLEHTHFVNSHGLDEPDHHTSASDLATLAEYAMRNPVFREMVAAETVRIPGPDGQRTIETSNILLGRYEGADGVKTGWTDDAGYCVVASAERDGIQLVAVVLGADSDAERFNEAEQLLDWGFSHYRLQTISSAESTAALVPVSDYLDRTVAAVVASSSVVPVFDVEGEISSSVDVVSEVEAPVAAGDRLGTLNVRQGQRLLMQVPVIALEDVEAPDVWLRIKIWFTRAWRGIFGGQRQAASVSIM
ncbi:MAG: D-alanyl-D-alanine carboxypeptidase family protein [Coriobacteriia bacterium]|nr:D-alanyl-D-alanine carboxypeptidase family protein [Coriobacteriia bacterium]